MYSVLMVAALMLLGGCALHTPHAAYNTQGGVKAFDEEDAYILYALTAQQQGQHLAAAGLYEMLYHHAHKEEYKREALSSYHAAQDYQTMLERSRSYANSEADDTIAREYEVIALMALERYEEASERALALLGRSKTREVYLLVSETYLKLQQYDTAVKYLESAYLIDYDEVVLDQIAAVLYLNLSRQADAIAYLESHSRIHGCSKVICGRLAGFYAQQNHVDGMLSTYLRLYELERDPTVGDTIVKIYGYQKNYPRMIEFLQKYPLNDPLLLQLYVSQKHYGDAMLLAQKLYEESGDTLYLGQGAIYEYEAASKEQKDAALLRSVLRKLKKVISEQPTALYLNYLGYLMIDHNMEVAEGMGYVRRALELEPDSAFYLDSLAWGHYRLGECKKARALMKRVVEQMGSDDPEVASHIQAIDQCLKTNKGSKE